MVGLIEEIQVDAANSSAPIDQLLRRMKLAAAKLQLAAVETWVQHELMGYSGELPDYRRVYGEPKGYRVTQGWLPIYFPDASLMAMISEAPVAQPIGSLQDLLAHNTDGSLTLPMLPGHVATLNKILSERIPRAVWQVSRGHIVSIVSTVRNMALEWAIEMDRKGVRGEGLSFNSQEKAQAHIAMTTFNIGSIGSVVGNLGVGNTSGDIDASHHALTHIAEVASKIRIALPGLSAEGADSQRLASALDALETELRGSKPSSGKLTSFLNDARAALAGAAGNLASEGALAMIGAAIKALGG